MIGLLLAAALAGGSPDLLERASDSCDAAIASHAGQRYLQDSSYVDTRPEHINEYLAENKRRNELFWDDWASRTLEHGISPEERPLARRICSTKVLSYLDSTRDALVHMKFKIVRGVMTSSFDPGIPAGR